MILTPDGARMHRIAREGRASDAEAIGRQAGEALRAEAGSRLLRELDMTAGRVLVTRPEPGCSRTASRVAALGLEPVKLPVAEAQFDPLPVQTRPLPEAGARLR